MDLNVHRQLREEAEWRHQGPPTSLTRALEGGGHIMTSRFFRKYLKNGGAQYHQLSGTCAQIENTPCVQILTSQVKRSGHQVRSKSDVHSGTGLKLEGRAVDTVLV